MKRSLPIFLLLSQLGALLLTGAPSAAQAPQPRLVLAFYYAWYDEKTWTPAKVPDMPPAPYRSADRATIERHVQEARGAGIDALVQSWYGPGDNPTEANFHSLLDVAQAHGLRATVDFETTSPFMANLQSAIDGLSHLIGSHAQHPAFLQYNGKPVIFFWNQRRYSLETWASVRAQVDPEHNTLWIADGDDSAWLDVFDGLHMYMITWRVNTNPEYTASKMRKRVDQYNADHGASRLWIATAMPGYDDTRVVGRDSYVYPRSPDYYRRTWDAATASKPEMVIITSFNEWPEGTMIEPSVSYGRTYLDLTAELAARYKGSVAADPLQAATATPTAAPPPTATPAPTATSTPMPTPTATYTASPTATPSPTQTASPTARPTPSPTQTASPTARPMPSPTQTASPTARPTATATRTRTPTAVPPATATETPVVPTATRTLMGSPTYSIDGTIAPSTPVPNPGPGPSPGPPCLAAGLLVGAVTAVSVTNRRKSDR